MTDKLIQLFNECTNQLLAIGFDLSKEHIGDVSIRISKRNNKRYRML